MRQKVGYIYRRQSYISKEKYIAGGEVNSRDIVGFRKRGSTEVVRRQYGSSKEAERKQNRRFILLKRQKRRMSVERLIVKRYRQLLAQKKRQRSRIQRGGGRKRWSCQESGREQQYSIIVYIGRTVPYKRDKTQLVERSSSERLVEGKVVYYILYILKREEQILVRRQQQQLERKQVAIGRFQQLVRQIVEINQIELGR